MRRSLLWKIAYPIVALMLWGSAPADAAAIVGDQDVIPSVAVQTIDLQPGTPFNPGPTILTNQKRWLEPFPPLNGLPRLGVDVGGAAIAVRSCRRGKNERRESPSLGERERLS